MDADGHLLSQCRCRMGLIKDEDHEAAGTYSARQRLHLNMWPRASPLCDSGVQTRSDLVWTTGLTSFCTNYLRKQLVGAQLHYASFYPDQRSELWYNLRFASEGGSAKIRIVLCGTMVRVVGEKKKQTKINRSVSSNIHLSLLA